MPARTKSAVPKVANGIKYNGSRVRNHLNSKIEAAAKLTETDRAPKKRKAEDSSALPNGFKSATDSIAPPDHVTKKTKTVEIGKKINEAPSRVLDIYVFGEGSSGELGLGNKPVNGKKPVDVKRPRLNENLKADAVGVVQVSCGGMHVLALTKENKILTWGVNDQGTLGRDTTWEGGFVDMKQDSDSESDDGNGMNPLESTPTALSDQHFTPGTRFVQVAASDSASFALTEDGRVYGWGTFRSSDGILGFSKTIKVQSTPVLLPTMKNIKALSAGANHILALDHKGNVLAWGCGQQNQLGRRIIERNKMSSLLPQGIGLPRGKIVKVACGAYHSFALDSEGHVWAWGLNNFGELGVEGNAGEKDAVVLKPKKLVSLEGSKISDIDGGVHHSVACSEKGELFTWGRLDGFQVGFAPEALAKDDIIFDERGNPRILVKPTQHKDLPNIAAVAAGTDNSFAVAKDGRVYSWGFSANYQTGQGTIEDIQMPTLIDNTAIRGMKIVVADAGGQFSIVGGLADLALDAHENNGVNGA